MAPKTLDPVRPNVGIERVYQRKLDAAIEDMHNSVLYWVTATYRKGAPEIAMDTSPAMALRLAMRKLTRRWQRNFDRLAPEMAEIFAKSTSKQADTAMKAALRKHGWAVQFKASKTQNDAFQAVIGEQVSLIKSISAEYLPQVEGILMRSVQNGRDLGQMTQELEERLGVTKRRATFIATDQNNKATAVYARVRQQELGIVEAIWLHSAGGRVPRLEHVAFSGKRYTIAKGAFLEGKWVWPGSEPRCRCVSKPLIPGFDP